MNSHFLACKVPATFLLFIAKHSGSYWVRTFKFIKGRA